MKLFTSKMLGNDIPFNNRLEPVLWFADINLNRTLTVVDFMVNDCDKK